MNRRCGIFTACWIVFSVTSAGAADWIGFRGPGGLATSDQTSLPTEWSGEENVAWRTELPGLGTSSPVTLGERIFLTCYNGYGVKRDDPGKMDDLTRFVVCLDR